MTIRVGINGFGRIGRTYLRSVLASGADVEVVAVNDLADPTMLATLLEWDSISGHLDGVSTGQDEISVAGKSIRVFSEANPALIPWGDAGVDVVIESSGRFTNANQARDHLQGGAKKVIISAPAKGNAPTVVLGVNDHEVDLAASDVLSNGSCTTNSLAPMAKVLNDSFGIETGLMTTVHAYTGDQSLQDSPHSDPRRARAASVSTIPTSSGAAAAIGTVIPELEGKLTGAALRVPIPVGSITDLTVVLNQPASTEEINAAFARAAESGPLSPYMEYSTAPIVSCDIAGNPHSAIIDAPLTQSVGNQVKVSGWYDNEWGFSNRLVELSSRLAEVL